MPNHSPGVVSLVSSQTSDHLLDEGGEEFTTQLGGPAVYVEKALAKEHVDYRLHLAPKMRVNILVTMSGEYGMIPTKPISKSISDLELSDWVIVSTVVDEWHLPISGVLPKYLFVDLQGFVRNPADFGKKQLWEIPLATARKIYCLKGTSEEVRYLPTYVLADQKKRLLVITKGADGVTIFYRNRSVEIDGKKLSNLRDTIGAGDTFFGYFVASLMKGNTPPQAAQYAIDRTVHFLIETKVG